MQRLRSFYDADRADKFSAPTNYRTAQNQHEVYCGLCGEAFYVDDSIFEHVNKELEETLENPFVCEDCSEEYQELSHRA
jgi:uncharacterized protein YbaR (Trm112 family)